MNKEEVTLKINDLVSDYLRLEPSEVTPESHIINDMGADSLALVELGFKFADTFNIGMLTPDDNLLVMKNLSEHIFNEMN